MTALVYLDYAASAPIDPRVTTRMAPFHAAANASSAHVAGREAADAVEQARAEVAALVGGRPGEVIFTSGGTEADNLAIGGVIRTGGAGHVVTTAAEHKAVLETAKAWCLNATVLGVDSDGGVDPERVAEAISPETVLVSVMTANNEVGTLSRIDEIGEICRSRDVLFHTDAAQAVGKIPIDVHSWPVDMVSISAHKMYGPQGIGALWVRREIRDRITPLLYGGGHERGFRSGTTNVAGCIGFGEAARILQSEAASDFQHSRKLRTHLLSAVRHRFDRTELNGSHSESLPGIVNVRITGVDAESLLLATPHVAASTGSACTSAVPAPSHVLLAIGLGHAAASESIRFSFGRFTTAEEIDRAVEALVASADKVRQTNAEVPA